MILYIIYIYTYMKTYTDPVNSRIRPRSSTEQAIMREMENSTNVVSTCTLKLTELSMGLIMECSIYRATNISMGYVRVIPNAKLSLAIIAAVFFAGKLFKTSAFTLFIGNWEKEREGERSR